MQVFPSRNQFSSNPAASALLNCLLSNEEAFGIEEAMLYHSFPLYRDEEGGLIVSDTVLLSPQHGVVVFALSTEDVELSENEIERCSDISEQVPSYVHSRLIKNRQLRKSPTRLAFEISPVTYAPLLPDPPDLDFEIVNSDAGLGSYLKSIESFSGPMSETMFSELIATIEGAKGLIRPKKRVLPSEDESSKGKQAELVEAAITLFDQQQKHGMMGRVNGPQRIRGLAGSGKTVVLAMMAAQAHLQNPTAKIAYTFYTKSLYQHVKRLITRFYRQFDDRDPDWDKCLQILHGWGGISTPGLYSTVCEQHGVTPMSFQEANAHAVGDKFDYACTSLLKSTSLLPVFDYLFVDEGQDFPISFMQLCHAVAKEGKFVLAYDDLQTIFQPTTPSTVEIFGAKEDGTPLVEFEEDIVLYKCYRNPREVLVAAHALGFGIYGQRIVQMIESQDHWEDVGYEVKEGDLVEGSQVIVERPKENSLSIISDRSGFDEIVQAHSYANQAEEITSVAESIKNNLKDGLEPEDILVVSVDDRNAKSYLSGVDMALSLAGIRGNNLHSDSYGIRDFSKDGMVTLSTVHKAKGNEAFMVYVVGVDAAMNRPDVRKRNMMFTAMTRAKGWVRLSGIGEGADRCVAELEEAKKHFPCLVFQYPGPEELKIMRRDLAEAADKKLKARRLIEQLQEEYSEAEIQELLKESAKKKGATKRRSPRRKGGNK